VHSQEKTRNKTKKTRKNLDDKTKPKIFKRKHENKMLG
jgi:hypothetical protein